MSARSAEERSAYITPQPDAFAAAQARARARHDLIASTPRPITMPARRGGYANPVDDTRATFLISLDPTKSRCGALRWRVTRWEGDTPTGHVEAADWASAIKEADYAGGDLGAAKDAEVSGG